MKTIASHLPSQVLTFVRHGATEPNLAGLRCGGDLDVALSATGRTQALSAAKQLRALGWPVGAIVCSDLQRTRETAHIIKDSFPYVDLMIAPGFAERHLGSWNLLPISQTEDELNAGATPPGGESREAFSTASRLLLRTCCLAFRACRTRLCWLQAKVLRAF